MPKRGKPGLKRELRETFSGVLEALLTRAETEISRLSASVELRAIVRLRDAFILIRSNLTRDHEALLKSSIHLNSKTPLVVQLRPRAENRPTARRIDSRDLARSC